MVLVGGDIQLLLALLILKLEVVQVLDEFALFLQANVIELCDQFLSFVLNCLKLLIQSRILLPDGPHLLLMPGHQIHILPLPLGNPPHRLRHLPLTPLRLLTVLLQHLIRLLQFKLQDGFAFLERPHIGGESPNGCLLLIELGLTAGGLLLQLFEVSQHFLVVDDALFDALELLFEELVLLGEGLVVGGVTGVRGGGVTVVLEGELGVVGLLQHWGFGGKQLLFRGAFWAVGHVQSEAQQPEGLA